MNYILNKFISMRVVKNDRVVIKTPLDVIEIKSENLDVIVEILKSFKTGATIEELCKKYDYDNINELIINLIDKKVLIKQIEIDTNKSDVYEFIEQFIEINSDSIFDIKKINILALGSTLMINYLNEDLRDIGFNNIFNFELKYNNNDLADILEILSHNKIDLLVYFDNVYNPNLCSFINKRCIGDNISFIFGHLKNLKAILGPIIIPNETPCLNCLELRKISNYEFIDLEKYFIKEYDNLENQNILYPKFVYKIISKIISLEMYKFYLNNKSCNLLGKELEIDLKNYTAKYNRILYHPQCQVCS